MKEQKYDLLKVGGKFAGATPQIELYSPDRVLWVAGVGAPAEESEKAMQDANRIVTCWNACDGISDSALQNGVIQAAMQFVIQYLYSEHNECRETDVTCALTPEQLRDKARKLIAEI